MARSRRGEICGGGKRLALVIVDKHFQLEEFALIAAINHSLADFIESKRSTASSKYGNLLQYWDWALRQ
jgi:hypothetical protein